MRTPLHGPGEHAGFSIAEGMECPHPGPADLLTALAGKQVPQERTQAEQVLRVFGQSTEYLPHCKVGHSRWQHDTQHVPRAALLRRHAECTHQAAPPAASLSLPLFSQALLDNSRSPYAQHLASSSLLKLLTEHSLTCVLVVGEQHWVVNGMPLQPGHPPACWPAGGWSMEHTKRLPVYKCSTCHHGHCSEQAAPMQQSLRWELHYTGCCTTHDRPHCIISLTPCAHHRPHVRVEMKNYLLSYLSA